MSTGYLKDEAPCFIEVIEYDNTGFDHKVVEDKDGKEDGKEVVTDSEEETSKKRARCKAKRDVVWAPVLLLADMPGLSAPASASMPVLGSSAAVPGSSTLVFASVLMLRSSVAVLELSAAMPGSSVAVLESLAIVLGLSALESASVPLPRSSAPVPLSKPMLSELSPLPFPTLSSPKTLMPNLAAER